MKIKPSIELKNGHYSLAGIAPPVELNLSANHRLLKRIDRSIEIALQYCSASNWSDVYPHMSAILSKTRNSKLENPQLLKKVEVIQTLYLDAPRLTTLMKDVLATCANLKRPLHSFTVEYFLQRALSYWLVSRPQEYLQASTSESELGQVAANLFEHLFVSTENTKRPLTSFCLLSSLLVFHPYAFIEEHQISTPTKSKVLTFKRHALKKHFQTFLAPLIAAATAPSSRKTLKIIASSMGVIRAASVLKSLSATSPILDFAVKLYPMLLQQLFGTIETDRDMNFILSHYQAMFVTYFSVLEPNALIRDVFPVADISVHEEYVVYVPNIIQGHLDLRQIPLFREDYYYVLNHVYELFRAAHIGANRLLTAYEARPDFKAELENSDLHQCYVTVVSKCFLLYRLDPGQVVKVRNYRTSYQEDELFLTVVNSALSSNKTLRTQAIDFCWSYLDEKNLSSFDFSDFKADNDNPVIPSFLQIGALAQALAEKIRYTTYSNELLIEYLTLLKGCMNGRHFLVQHFQFRDVFGSDPTSIEQAEYQQKISSTIESTMYLSILSSDITVCKLAFEIVGCLVQEAIDIENFENIRGSHWSIMPNFAAFSDFGNSSHLLTGPVAVQKRLFRFFQHLQVVTPPVLAAWETVSARWRKLSEELRNASSIDRSSINLWKSYSGMLCSLISPWLVVGNETTVEGNLSKTSKGILNEMLQFLTNSKSPFLREVAREVLARDTPHSSYHYIFRTIEADIVERITSSPSHFSESTFLLLEQGVFLLRSVVGVMNDGELYLSTDIGALALTIVQCLDSVTPDLRVIRLRVQYCALMDLISSHKDTLNVKYDKLIRRQIVTIFAGWVDKCLSSKLSPVNDSESIISGSSAGNSSHRRQELEHDRLQMELLCAVLQTFTTILSDLEMDPDFSDPAHEKDIFDAKTQKFGALFTLFLKILERCRAEETGSYIDTFILGDRLEQVKANAIIAAAKLLNANIDVGLKFALPLGNKNDHFIRVSFIKILENILTHTSEESVEISDLQKYHQLANFLTKNMDVTILLCDVCPAADVENFSSALLQVFDMKGQGLEFVKLCVTGEINKADSTMDVLRRNCVATKILSIYAHQKGLEYLKATLGPFLRDIVAHPDVYCFDLTTEKRSKDSSAEANFAKFELTLGNLVSALQTSIDSIPTVLRDICCTIAEVAGPAFPKVKDASVTAVSAFFFLRFLCPSLVSPDTSGLLSEPPSKEVRRTLLFLAKMLQNMAITSSNASKLDIFKQRFISSTAGSKSVVAFLKKISEHSKIESSAPSASIFGDYQDELRNFDVLHNFLYAHWEDFSHKLHMEQRLQNMNKSSRNAALQENFSDDTLEGATQELSILIRSLGRPRHQSTKDYVKNISSGGHVFPETAVENATGLSEFLQRNKDRDMSSIIERGVYSEGMDNDGTPLLMVNTRNFNKEDIDVELSICRYFHIGSNIWKHKFAYFIDVTQYTLDNIFPPSAQAVMNSMLPEVVKDNCVGCYFYNVSSDYLPYLKTRIKETSDGIYLNPLNVRCEIFTGEELAKKFNVNALNLDLRTLRIMEDGRITFENAFRFNTDFQEMKNVSVTIGNEYVQIRMKDPFTLPTSPPAFVNDIFALRDIKNVYKSSTNGHSNGITIEVQHRHRVKTVLLLSNKNQEIMGAILNAKARLGNERKQKSLALSPESSLASLLNIALSGLCSAHPEIQEASYNLMASIQSKFKLNLGIQLHGGKGIRLPANLFNRVQLFSAAIAKERPDITMDMIEGVFAALEVTSEERRQGVIRYIVPWVNNIETHVLEGHYEEKKIEVASAIRKFLDISVNGSSNQMLLLQLVWSAFLQESMLISIVIDEIVFLLIDHGIDDGPLLENTVSIVTSHSSPEVCGIIIQRIREMGLGSTYITKIRLRSHPKWREFVILITMLSAIVFENSVVSENFYPELALIILLFLHTGPYSFRVTLYNLFVNMLHSLLYSSRCNEGKRSHIRTIWEGITGSKGALLFGISEEMRHVDFDYPTSSLLFQVELGCALLAELVQTFTTSKQQDQYTKFFIDKCLYLSQQNFSVMQSRALLALGCVARLDNEDELTTQVLRVLYDGLQAEEGEFKDELMACTLFSISRIAEGLHLESKHLPRLFWLSVALLSSTNSNGFIYALHLLQSTLKNLNEYGAFKHTSVAAYLLKAKDEFDLEWSLLEKNNKVHFTEEFFEVTLAAILTRGLEHSTTRATTLAAFETLLTVGSRAGKVGNSPLGDDSSSLGLSKKRSTSSFGQVSISSNPSGLSNYVLETPMPHAQTSFNMHGSPSFGFSSSGHFPHIDRAEAATISSDGMDFTANIKKFPSYMPFLVMLYLSTRSTTDMANFLWMTDYPEEVSDEVPSLIRAYINGSDDTAVLTLYVCSLVFRQAEVEELTEIRVLKCMKLLADANLDNYYMVYFTLRSKIQNILDKGQNFTILEPALEVFQAALSRVSELHRISQRLKEIDSLLLRAGLAPFTTTQIGVDASISRELSKPLPVVFRLKHEIAQIIRPILENEDSVNISAGQMAEEEEGSWLVTQNDEGIVPSVGALDINDSPLESKTKKLSISGPSKQPKKLGNPISSIASLTVEGPPSKFTDMSGFGASHEK